MTIPYMPWLFHIRLDDLTRPAPHRKISRAAHWQAHCLRKKALRRVVGDSRKPRKAVEIL